MTGDARQSTPIHHTAQHWVATDFGDLDVLHLQDTDVAVPAENQVTIEVKAAGMNPADYKYIEHGDTDSLPVAIGYEVAGVIAAIGANTHIASGGGVVGDEVIAYKISGGYASAVTVSADDVFAKPAGLAFAGAANLLLVGTTAAEMLHVTGVVKGETILVHGASGAVGVSVLQQAKLIGVRVIGTASENSFAAVRRFGAQPVSYGEGLEQRVRDTAPEGIAAALDCVGTDEAVDVSLRLVDDKARIVTIAPRTAPKRTASEPSAAPCLRAQRSALRSARTSSALPTPATSSCPSPRPTAWPTRSRHSRCSSRVIPAESWHCFRR